MQRTPRIQAFGGYDLVERIGFGAMGEVFRAVERDTGRNVALKRLMPFVSTDGDVIDALYSEAKLASALDHPSVAKVLDVGEVRGVHYIAYEYVHGRDLRTIRERAAKQGSEIPLDFALHVAVRLAAALHHAHERRDPNGRPLGLVHRDVCPSNVLVSFDGDVKLADFGIARAEGRAAKTAVGTVKGTIGYMSPEQVMGQPVDGRSDVYALGVILWELATGERLFDDAPALVLMERVASGQVPSPRAKKPSLSLALEAIVLKSLAQSPDRRYATAAQLETDLLRLIHDEGRQTDPSRIARYVRSLFPEAAADSAASQEWLNMADSKGGSDLDVFEGLAKKPKSINPGLTPPPPSARQRTLVGGLVGSAPPLPPPSGSTAPPPSPSMPGPSGAMPPLPPAPSTLPAAVAPPPAPPAAPLPPPMAPPSGRSASGSLPPVSAPPPKISAAPPAPLPPPPASGRAAGPLPPPTMPPKTPLPPPPPGGSATAPAAPAPPSVGTALGMPDGKPAVDAKSVDMDWDDDEESTHVYDKATHDVMPKLRPAAGTPAVPPPVSAPPAKVSAAAALLASSGTAAAAAKPQPSAAPPPGAAPAPASVHIGPMPVPSTPTPAPSAAPAPASRAEDTAVRARPAPAPAANGGSKAGLIMGLIALLAVAGMAAFLFIPRTGQFKIDIKSKSGAPIAKAEIFIDGVKKCDTAPCVVTDLPAGPKTIKVIAGDAPAGDPVTETVEAGKEKLVFITIDDGATAQGTATSALTGTSAASTGGTGFKARSTQAGVKVFVDGADKGVLPIELKDLSPGSHKVRFEGPNLEPLEQTVDVVASQMKDLGNIKLKVQKGTLAIVLVTPGAAVTLQSEGPKKERKALDGILKVGQEVKVQDIDASQSYKLIASKKGYKNLVQTISFDDGEAEKSIRIELFEEGATPPATADTKEPPKDQPKEQPAAAAGSGTLNINSIPVSKVILDGRPLGSTPKVGISVPAGNHTVTFIHPELGKKSVTVSVKAGETKTAAVKFK